MGLGERVRARVEESGRVEFDDVEAKALARTKIVHVSLIVVAVLSSVKLVGSGDDNLAFCGIWSVHKQCRCNVIVRRLSARF